MRFALLIGVAIGAACASPAPPGVAGEADNGVVDDAGSVPQDVATGEVGTPDAGHRAGVWDACEVKGSAAQPAPHNCPCDGPEDCQDGYCVDSADGKKRCTEVCVDSCPEGWVCASQVVAGSDSVNLCTQPLRKVCAPCQANADCAVDGSDGNFCVDYGGAQGSFCSLPCDAGHACPSGYDCREGQRSVDGTTIEGTGQCVLTEGTCSCSAWAIQNSASTRCVRVGPSAGGSCEGERVCTADGGLSACDAAEPAPEKCDNVDNDCNGTTDEGSFPCDSNPNGFGSCSGTASCEAGKPVGCSAPVAAADTCDGQDNNCNGESDEGFPDSDGDLRADCRDNCVGVPNPDQTDTDGDGAGDACDPCDQPDDGAPCAVEACMIGVCAAGACTQVQPCGALGAVCGLGGGCLPLAGAVLTVRTVSLAGQTGDTGFGPARLMIGAVSAGITTITNEFRLILGVLAPGSE